MDRLAIDLPGNFHFSTDIQVQTRDLNPAGHVGNDTFVGYLNEICHRFLNTCGVPLRNTIMADLAIKYRSEAFYGDILKGEVAVKVAGDNCNFYYQISNTTTGKEILRAWTRMAFFNYEERKRAPVPEKLRSFES